MSDVLIIGISVISILLLLFAIRVPVGFSLLLVGFGGIWYLKNYNAASLILVSTAYNTVSNYVLISVPLFILMGHLSLNAGLAQKAYSAGFKIVGGLPGGLAMASSIGCGVFAAATGSSAATAATLGKVAVPEMKKYGYDSGFACAAVAGGGSIGILIPPSIVLIIYGMITDLSIGKLLIAGVIPGILTIIANMLVSYFSAIINPKLAPRGPKTSLREKISSMSGLWGFIILILIVLGGIYSGVATPTESAAVGALGAFILALPLVIKEPKILVESLIETSVTTSMIFIIIVGASLFTMFLSIANIPATLTESVISVDMPRMYTLAMILLLYIPLGMFLGPIEIMLITLPIVFPVLIDLGFNGIWLGILLVKMMEIGYVTPPLGMNVFVLHGMNPQVSLKSIFGHSTRFIGADLVVLLLCIIFPFLVYYPP